MGLDVVVASQLSSVPTDEATSLLLLLLLLLLFRGCRVVLLTLVLLPSTYLVRTQLADRGLKTVEISNRFAGHTHVPVWYLIDMWNMAALQSALAPWAPSQNPPRYPYCAGTAHSPCTSAVEIKAGEEDGERAQQRILCTCPIECPAHFPCPTAAALRRCRPGTACVQGAGWPSWVRGTLRLPWRH
jgi:hypothetical protein